MTKATDLLAIAERCERRALNNLETFQERGYGSDWRTAAYEWLVIAAALRAMEASNGQS